MTPQSDRLYFAPCHITAPWTALSNDTTGLTTSTKGLRGTCLTYAKANGADNKVYAGVYTSFSSPLNLLGQPFDEYSRLFISLQITTLTNVASAAVWLSSETTFSVSNLLTYTWADTTFTTLKWLSADAQLGAGTMVGNGANLTSIQHAAILVNFDSEANTLAAADILWSSVGVTPVMQVET